MSELVFDGSGICLCIFEVMTVLPVFTYRLYSISKWMSNVGSLKGRDSSFDSTAVFISSSGNSNPKSSRTFRKGTAFCFHFSHVSTLSHLSVSLLCLIFASRIWQFLNPFRIKGWLFTSLSSKDQTENCIKKRKYKENVNVWLFQDILYCTNDVFY